MKKLQLFVACVIIALGVNAQEKGSSEFKVAYGIGTLNQIGSIVTDIITYPVTLGTISTDNAKYSGAFMAEYNYAVIDKLTLGSTFTYEHNSKDVYSTISAVKTLLGKQTENAFTLAINGQYNYISGSAFRLYSGIGAGYTLYTQKLDTEKSSDGYFSYQLTALGLRFGKKIGFHTEFGFGYKGIFNAGLSYNF